MVLTAGVAEIEKSPKYTDNESVAVSLPLVTSAPLTAKMKGLALVGESPPSVNILELGTVVELKAMLDGLKEHVPGEQERATVSVKFKLGGADMLIVKVVAAVPMGRNCVVVGEVNWKLGFPVPVKAMLDEPLVTLSVTVRLPLRTPVLVGVKVMEKLQLPPTAMVNGYAGQVFVSAKSPEAAIFVTVKGVSPLFVIVTFCAALVVFKVVAGNTRLLGENCTCARPVMPVPVSVTR